MSRKPADVVDIGLHALAQHKWKSSGLEEKHARALKLQVLSGEEIRKLAPNFQKLGGIKISYFDAHGKLTDFFRVRYLEQPTGFLAHVKKPQRYAQPANTLNEIYLPPLLNSPWDDVLRAIDIPIFITEGEFKAACGCVNGFATMGLGGVDMWRAKKRGLSMLPLLKNTRWTGRAVVIVYDSDAATNPDVVRAQLQLSEELILLGARVSIASLPPADDGEKQGLDDFLMNRGREAFTALLEKLQGLEASQALWALNNEVVYITDPGFVVRRDNGQTMSASAFVQHGFSNRIHRQLTQNSKGTVVAKEVSTAAEWMKWPSRYQLARLTYAPGLPQVTDDGEWNTWRGWGCLPVQGDVAPWKELLAYVFRGEPPEVVKWFESWLAYPLQHPGTKLYTSTAIWGRAQGTGKSLIGVTMGRIYGHNYTKIEDKDLHGNFNSWAKNKQFILGDEVTGNDSRAYADRLKGLVTQEKIRINEKYVAEYEVPDCINYYFTSNHPDAFFLEDTDRRFFVHELKGVPAARDFYKRYDKWMKSPAGAAALFHHFLQLDVTDFDPKGPAMGTRAKEEMIVDAKSDLALWVHKLREDPEGALFTLGDTERDADMFTTAQLFNAFTAGEKTRATVNAMSREMKRSGFIHANRGLPVRSAALGPQKLFIVRNREKWEEAEPREIAEHIDKYNVVKKEKF